MELVMMNPTLKHIGVEIVDWLKYPFGLLLYTYLWLIGRFKWRTHFLLVDSLCLAWAVVLLSAYACFAHPSEMSVENVRALYLNLVVMFVFTGTLVHVKAERDRLIG